VAARCAAECPDHADSHWFEQPVHTKSNAEHKSVCAIARTPWTRSSTAT
jgi:hypothetical protein